MLIVEISILVCAFVSSADVNPEHHVRILEALIATGGLMEMQAAPGRIINMHTNVLPSPHTPYAFTFSFCVALYCGDIMQYDFGLTL